MASHLSICAFEENMAFVIWSKPWYIHAANVGIEDLDGEPVYTAT